jgi:hypothetical protein
MNAVVFLGPTLPRAEAADLLSATYLPPARQGDIYRAVRALRPTALGLVDGRFLDTGAVWHREILWALSEGVHVFGAASMGALRAAELAPYGMRGIGQVFAAFRDGCWPSDAEAFEDDDEVAVIHAPPELGGGALSDAMVDLRATLAAAEAAGVIAASDRRLLTAALKRRPFGERSFGALLEDAARLLHTAIARRLAAWLPDNKVARKRLDAIEMLQAISALLATSPPPPRFAAEFVMQQPLFWRRFVAECDADEADALDPAARRVLERLRRDPDAWHACARAALGRLPPTAGGTMAAAEVPPHRALDRLRRERGLWRRSDLLAWMAANGLDEAGLERLLLREDELDRLVAAEAPAGLLRAMADHLRLSGGFAAILREVVGEP